MNANPVTSDTNSLIDAGNHAKRDKFSSMKLINASANLITDTMKSPKLV